MAYWHYACNADHLMAEIFNSMRKELNEKSILVVDDDERMLRALDKVLTGEGATVMCSSWAGSAIGVVAEKKIEVDLVIIDLCMPFISGLTTVHALHNYCPRLPIIVLTAYGSPTVKAECLREGAAAFLEKPLDSSVLIDAIAGVLAPKEDGTNKSGRMAKEAGEDEGR
ncbi:MAG TPA: response regulator [Alphaproteobacteria bacterium]|nr:response regulator [Alphaproteobacteria bacterium]